MMHSLYDAMAAVNIPTPPPNARPKSGGFTRYGTNKRYWMNQQEGVVLFGDWTTGKSHHWFEDSGKPLDTQQDAARKSKLLEMRRQQEQEQMQVHDEKAVKSEKLWNAILEEGNSIYLQRKQVKALGVRFCKDSMVVPLRDIDGKLWSLQFIKSTGEKRFISGGKKRGCFHTIGHLGDSIIVAEGYATAASIHMATGITCIVAFDAGNLEPVIEALRNKYPNMRITIAADNDRWKLECGNPGKEKAEEAAKRFTCCVALPEFPDPTKEHQPTDWNDLHCLVGIEEVKRQFSVSMARKTLVAHTLHDFLRLEIPPRETILAPVIPTQGLVMIYAMRGAGKTYVSLTMALAVAAGTATLGGRWVADTPRRVLYVDGEMPASVLQDRLASLTLGLGKELPAPDYLRIITPDMQERGVPDLGTAEGQETIEQHLEGVGLLILDNLSALMRHGKENEAESWLPIQGWLLSLRKRGISVLLVHHANKGGGQRGTSKREDLLDTVIALKRPDDYDPQRGAQFSVHYEKARGFFGDEAKPFEARLVSDGSCLCWEVKDVEDSELARALELQAEGLTQREIAQEMGCSAPTVNRLLKRGKAEGR